MVVRGSMELSVGCEPWLCCVIQGKLLISPQCFPLEDQHEIHPLNRDTGHMRGPLLVIMSEPRAWARDVGFSALSAEWGNHTAFGEPTLRHT